MLPRLEAEESFLAVNRLAVGVGTARKEDRRRILADWQKRGRPAQRATRRLSPQMLAQMGFGVRRVAKAPKATT